MEKAHKYQYIWILSHRRSVQNNSGYFWISLITGHIFVYNFSIFETSQLRDLGPFHEIESVITLNFLFTTLTWNAPMWTWRLRAFYLIFSPNYTPDDLILALGFDRLCSQRHFTKGPQFSDQHCTNSACSSCTEFVLNKNHLPVHAVSSNGVFFCSKFMKLAVMCYMYVRDWYTTSISSTKDGLQLWPT